jgi:hypothetical protein
MYKASDGKSISCKVGPSIFFVSRLSQGLAKSSRGGDVRARPKRVSKSSVRPLTTSEEYTSLVKSVAAYPSLGFAKNRTPPRETCDYLCQTGYVSSANCVDFARGIFSEASAALFRRNLQPRGSRTRGPLGARKICPIRVKLRSSESSSRLSSSAPLRAPPRPPWQRIHFPAKCPVFLSASRPRSESLMDV